MKNFCISAAVTFSLGLLSYQAQAQQTVGASTLPGSTLDVRGSLAGNYLQVTSASYTMLATDFFLAYNGSTNGTVTLPAANTNTISSSTTNFKGRIYHIKNSSSSQLLTVATSGAGEAINGQQTLTVSPGQSIQLISTGLAAGAAGSPNGTWEVISFDESAPIKAPTSAVLYLSATANTSVPALTITSLNMSKIIFNSGDFLYNAATGIITIKQPGVYLASVQTAFTGPLDSNGNTTDIASNTQLVAGIANVDGNGNSMWIGRGTRYTPPASSTPLLPQLHNVSSPVVLTVGQQIRFSVVTNQPTTAVAAETGATGTGTVTSAILQKISN